MTVEHQAIMEELQRHNREIGGIDREEDRLNSDARFVAMLRHDGVTPETLCMMLTDAQFSVNDIRRMYQSHRLNVATQMACGILAEEYQASDTMRDDSMRIVARLAVRMADILIDEVGKPREEQP